MVDVSDVSIPNGGRDTSGPYHIFDRRSISRSHVVWMVIGSFPIMEALLLGRKKSQQRASALSSYNA
jgi:hypothetical protein